MTSEEKVICKEFLNDADKTHSCNEYKLLMALLEQETVSKEVYDHEYYLCNEFEIKIAKLEHDKNKVLNKIRAEIIEKFGESECAEECGCLYELLEIIDKHKGESEET